VQSRKVKPEPNIMEAAEKTGLLIRGLQSRLAEGGEAQEPLGETVNLERQLQDYFACWPGETPGNGPLNQIRNRVIDGVADRILRGWQQDGSAHPFENEVIERLIDGVLDMLITNGKEPARKGANVPAGPKSAITQLQA